jgi:hypothetical protein
VQLDRVAIHGAATRYPAAGNVGGAILYPVDGADILNLGAPGHTTETIYRGAYYNASSQQVIEAITNDASVSQQEFCGNAAGSSGNASGTSAEKPVVNHFAPGATGDMPAQTGTVLGSGWSGGQCDGKRHRRWQRPPRQRDGTRLRTVWSFRSLGLRRHGLRCKR